MHATLFTLSTLLLANLLGALVFRAYPPSFGLFTRPRTLRARCVGFPPRPNGACLRANLPLFLRDFPYRVAQVLGG